MATREENFLTRADKTKLRPGQFFAFDSGTGREVQGWLRGGKNPDSGDRIGNVFGNDVAIGNLRDGVRNGVKAGPVRMRTQPPVSVAGGTMATSTPATAAPRPNLAMYPTLNKVLANRQNNPRRFNLLKNNPKSGSSKERVEVFGLEPTISGDINTGTSSVARTWQRLQNETAKYNEAVAGAQESDTGFARQQSNARLVGERQINTEKAKQTGREALVPMKGEQDIAKIRAQGEERLKQITAEATERLKGQFAAGELPGSEPYKARIADEFTKMAEEARIESEQGATEDARKLAADKELELLRAAVKARPKTETSKAIIDDVNGKPMNVGTEKTTTTGAMPGAAQDTAGVIDANKNGSTADEVAQYNFLKETLASGVHPKTGKPLTPAEIDRANATIKRLKPTVVGE